MRDDLRAHVVEHLGAEAKGVLIVDETGFVKKGALIPAVRAPPKCRGREGMAQIAPALDIPVAAGEQQAPATTRRPSCCTRRRAGPAGRDRMREALRGEEAAALAGAFGKDVTTHTTSVGIGPAAHLHFWASTPACPKAPGGPARAPGAPHSPGRPLPPGFRSGSSLPRGRGPGRGWAQRTPRRAAWARGRGGARSVTMRTRTSRRRARRPGVAALSLALAGALAPAQAQARPRGHPRGRRRR